MCQPPGHHRPARAVGDCIVTFRMWDDRFTAVGESETWRTHYAAKQTRHLRMRLTMPIAFPRRQRPDSDPENP